MRSEKVKVIGTFFSIVLLCFLCSVDILGSQIKKVNEISEREISKLIEALGSPGDRINETDTLIRIGAPAIKPLVDALKRYYDPRVDFLIVGILCEIKDPRVATCLIAAAKGEGESARYEIAETLVRVGVPAVEPLIAELKDKKSHFRWGAAWTLGVIRDPRAVGVLITVVEDEASDFRSISSEEIEALEDPRELGALLGTLGCFNRAVRLQSAWALGEIGKTNDPRAVKFLLTALRNKKLEIVTEANRFYIDRGETGTEGILIEALNKYGDGWMATDYINCGNHKLEEAARNWFTSHGWSSFPITDISFVQWGKRYEYEKTHKEDD